MGLSHKVLDFDSLDLKKLTARFGATYMFESLEDEEGDTDGAEEGTADDSCDHEGVKFFEFVQDNPSSKNVVGEQGHLLHWDYVDWFKVLNSLAQQKEVAPNQKYVE